MKTRLYTLLASTALLLSGVLAACSAGGGSDEDTPTPPSGETPDNERTELCLSTKVELQSRTAYPSVDTQLPAGQKVAVWVDETGGTALYENNVLTANGSGGLSGGTTMFFPQGDNTVDIYALHPDFNRTDAVAFPSSFSHMVSYDQRTFASYALSDLLYAKVTNVARTTNVVPLTFTHLLSKLEVAIVAGDGLTASDITGVSINGTKTSAGITLSKTVAPTAVTISPSDLVMPITIDSDLSANFTAPIYNNAIIVPQTVTKGTPFVILHLAEGIDLAYLLPENTTFESRKKYTYHITVSRTGITLSTSVADWESGGLVTGEADILGD